MDTEAIKNKVLPILKQAGVTRSAIFGSYARGEADKESDLDILVDLPEGKSLFDLIDLKQTLEGLLGLKVDLLTYNLVSPLLRDYVFRDQVSVL